MSILWIVFGPVGAFVILNLDKDWTRAQISICIDEIVQTRNPNNPLVVLLIPKTIY
jgi:hypothetical protein